MAGYSEDGRISYFSRRGYYFFAKTKYCGSAGKVGETSGKTSSQLQYVIKYTGKFYDPKQYEEVPIRSDANGTILKLKDIAKVEFGAMNYGMVSKTDGRPSASIMMKQRPGSNASEVIKNVKAKWRILKRHLSHRVWNTTWPTMSPDFGCIHRLCIAYSD